MTGAKRGELRLALWFAMALRVMTRSFGSFGELFLASARPGSATLRGNVL